MVTTRLAKLRGDERLNPEANPIDAASGPGFDAVRRDCSWRTLQGYFRETLAWLHATHGGFEPYLLAHGFTEGELELLRASLVERSSAC